MTEIRDIMQLSPIIPVAVIEESVDEIKLAQALVQGGIPIIEVTLRTKGATDKIASIVSGVPSICVGAGTVWTAEEAEQVINAGAKFIVSPAYVAEVHQVCLAKNTPYLPGVQTVTEASRCVGFGLTALKLFPANIAGGPAIIKAIGSVIPDAVICPTGGVSGATAPDYLQLSSVPCVGGSWILDGDAVKNADWSKIQADSENALSNLTSA